ncbi:MAG: hypothetical protein WBN27_09745 [Eudoraea sp.]|uniref:hypothetical protein n=1 Tax=Eudoraea sp. TaxID=1979955 RepID=UPI003C738B4B
MKNYLKKLNFTGILLLAIVLNVSCNKEESPEIIETGETETFEVAQLQASDESELISEEILNIGEDVYAVDEIQATSKGSYISDYLPDCVTITTVVTSSSKEKIIDFGEGCELPNGNFLSGIIKLSYLKDMEMTTNTLSFSLENFTFNGVYVAGIATVERMRSNENGNPQSEAVANFTGEWPDGDTASFSGNRTREWIEGFGSGFWGDNVFLISGKGIYTGKYDNVFVKETISPLRRELSCRFLVSGILEITRNDTTVSLDFGDGSCDSKGILTYPNGESEEIFLRRFKN